MILAALIQQLCILVYVDVYCRSLEVEITCYFATKSVDEFLSLQQVRMRSATLWAICTRDLMRISVPQMANMEVIGAIQDCGAALALPTSLMQVDAMPGGGDNVAVRRLHEVSTTPQHAARYGTSTIAVAEDEEEGADADGAGNTAATVLGDSDLAAEMELSEALQDLPLQCPDDHEHDDVLPMGRAGDLVGAGAGFGAGLSKATATPETMRPLVPV